MLAAIVNVEQLVRTAGYPLLFLIVMSESSGAPVPGETGLLTAAILASQHKLKIELVIPLAAAGAIVGDNIGYLIGRKGGRWLLERPGAFEGQRRRMLTVGEPFFERHGPKAVFFGRFILGLRVWASWLAGATRMHWLSFLLWNALGGITWACVMGLSAYFLGSSASNAIQAFGLYGLLAVVVAVGGFFFMHRRAKRRGGRAAASRRPDEGPTRADGQPGTGGRTGAGGQSGAGGRPGAGSSDASEA